MIVARLDKATKVFPGGGPVLRRATLDVRRGEIVAVVGSSGSGKTTLLNILGLMDEPTSGAYWLMGRKVHFGRRDEVSQLRAAMIGFVFQSFSLIEHLTLAENVALPLFYRNVAVGEALRMAENELATVGLGGRGRARPVELSGGQQQRVAVARALISRPALILADEPTGSLDPDTALKVEELLFESVRGREAALILVTHDMGLAARCDRCYRIQDGELLT